MKAQRRPTIIDVIEFDPEHPPSYVMIRARPVREAFEVYNKLHELWHGLEKGDYLNVTDLDDVYPIGAAYFKVNYEVV